MKIRETLEERESMTLSKKASLAQSSRGRARDESPCDIRTCYMRDRDRIIHSKAFRRLKHKTQVFLAPEGDHYRTRLTHTLEVSQISRTIARALMLNEDLVEAVALGHDLGHTPFGHAGERILADICEGGFAHNVQSLRVVDKLENDGLGLNLTYEVRDGILCHTGNTPAQTCEGRIIHYADRIAYINHDVDDSLRAGVISDIPKGIRKCLGDTTSARINTLVRAAIDFWQKNGEVGMTAEKEKAMLELREYMFERVYRNPKAQDEEKKDKAILKSLYEYYLGHIHTLPEEFAEIAEKEGASRAACDYIAGMTDSFALSAFSQIFIPHGWHVV